MHISTTPARPPIHSLVHRRDTYSAAAPIKRRENAMEEGEWGRRGRRDTRATRMKTMTTKTAAATARSKQVTRHTSQVSSRKQETGNGLPLANTMRCSGDIFDVKPEPSAPATSRSTMTWEVRRMSDVTRHASNVTHHASHITRHTPYCYRNSCSQSAHKEMEWVYGRGGEEG